MKNVILLILLIGFVGGSLPVFAVEQTQSFAVAKMTCAVCPVTVKKAMENVDGVKSVTVEFDTKTATVTFDDAVTTTDAVAEASTNAGYPATLIAADSS